MQLNEERSLAIWKALYPINPKTTTFKCTGTKAGINQVYKMLMAMGGKKPFLMSKSYYVAAASVLVEDRFASTHVELKLRLPNRPPAFWYSDGTLRKQGQEEVNKFLGEVGKMFDLNNLGMTDFAFGVQLDITNVYGDIKHLLDPLPQESIP